LLSKEERSKTNFSRVDWKDGKSVSAFVTERWRTRDQWKLPLERQWFLNVAWFLGQQNTILDGRNEVHTPPVPPWRVRMICNLLSPHVRTAQAKLMRAKPIWDVVPATTDTDDVSIARVSKKTLEYYWRYLAMSSTVDEAIMWMFCTGGIMFKTCWDPDAGHEFSVTPYSMSQYEDKPDEKTLINRFKDQFGWPHGNEKLNGQRQTMRLGEPAVEIASYFEVMPEHGKTRLEDCEWIIHSKLRTYDYVRNRYGKEAEKLRPIESESSDGLYYQRRIQDLAGMFYNFGTTNSMQYDDEMVIVHELFVKPSSHLPSGVHAVVCDDTVLSLGENKYRCLPFDHAREIIIPGRFWGACSLEQMMPIQSDYNRTRSHMIENRNMMSNPKWLVPMGSGVPKSSLTGEPGEVVPYTLGMKPEMVDPPSLPPYVETLLDRHRRDMEDISGFHEVTQARTPPNVRSGRAIMALKEGDDTRLTAVAERLDLALQGVGEKVLKVLHANVTEERLIKITGEDQALDVFTFKGTGIVGENEKPGVNYFDVRVQLGSKIQQSRAATLDIVEALVKLQVLNPQGDRDRILNILNLGDAQPALDQTAMDRAMQNNENMLMLQGTPVEAAIGHNHGVHLEQLDKFRKSQDYRVAAEQNPGIDELFTMHREMHQDLQAREAVTPQILLQKQHLLVTIDSGLAEMQGQLPGQGQTNQQGAPMGAPV